MESRLHEYAHIIQTRFDGMPRVIPDATRFSGLHSWYKHLGQFEVVYSILMKGEERKYEEPLRADFSDNNPNNHHWRFVFENDLSTYEFEFDTMSTPREIYPIPDDLVEFMKHYPIYVSNQLGQPPPNDVNKFHMKTFEVVTTKFWNDLKNMKLPNTTASAAANPLKPRSRKPRKVV